MDEKSASNASRKKPKVAGNGLESLKTTSSKGGKLAGLTTSLPLDIVYEVGVQVSLFHILCYHINRTLKIRQIFRHLPPACLLRLSRLTKDFRRFLMHRSSLPIWKEAREIHADGLPDPPDGVSEPAWADLAFDSRCHVRIFTVFHRSPLAHSALTSIEL